MEMNNNYLKFLAQKPGQKDVAPQIQHNRGD